MKPETAFLRDVTQQVHDAAEYVRPDSAHVVSPMFMVSPNQGLGDIEELYNNVAFGVDAEDIFEYKADYYFLLCDTSRGTPQPPPGFMACTTACGDRCNRMLVCYAPAHVVGPLNTRSRGVRPNARIPMPGGARPCRSMIASSAR